MASVLAPFVVWRLSELNRFKKALMSAYYETIEGLDLVLSKRVPRDISRMKDLLEPPFRDRLRVDTKDYLKALSDWLRRTMTEREAFPLLGNEQADVTHEAERYLRFRGALTSLEGEMRRFNIPFDAKSPEYDLRVRKQLEHAKRNADFIREGEVDDLLELLETPEDAD